MSIIYIFVSENPDGKYPWTIFLSLIYFFALGQSNKIKIRHMVASKGTKVIEWRRQLIATEILDPEDAAEDGSIDDSVDTSDE